MNVVVRKDREAAKGLKARFYGTKTSGRALRQIIDSNMFKFTKSEKQNKNPKTKICALSCADLQY